MKKRSSSPALDCEPPPKKVLSNSTLSAANSVIKSGEILTDVSGKQWKLGNVIGKGGFGEIFLVSDKLDKEVDNKSDYVAKIESHSNGPLFVEINCYLRIAKLEMINEWKASKNLKNIGMPHYIASGSHYIDGVKYRFLIIPRFKCDLENVLESKQRKFNLKTVLLISMQIIDILQYIHSKGFVHGDIKASNILLRFNKTKIIERKPSFVIPSQKRTQRCLRTCRKLKYNKIQKSLRSYSSVNDLSDDGKCDVKDDIQTVKLIQKDQVYLLDYGLASKFLLSNGNHKKFCIDERKAHAGTLLFCSLDAHKGAQSRRSDLESLGYNIIYWLTSNLPWSCNLDDPDRVHRKKERCIGQLDAFLKFCFGEYPKFLLEYFKLIKKLEFTTKPNYQVYKDLFSNALEEYGYKKDEKFDFDNLEGIGQYTKKKSFKIKNDFKDIANLITRTPLKSNVAIKPRLRKQKNLCMLNWSRILMDPEVILKKCKPKEKLPDTSDSSQSLSNIDINNLNPTNAMLEIYNSYMDRKNNADGSSPKYKGDCVPTVIEGYTSAMVQVYNNMMERKNSEIEKFILKNNNKERPTRNKAKKRESIKLRKPINSSCTRIKSKEKIQGRRTTSNSRIYRLRG